MGTFTVSNRTETVNVPIIDLARRMRRKWFADPAESVKQGRNGGSDDADARPFTPGDSRDSVAPRSRTASHCGS
jgi:hypothetical protein